MTSQLDSYWVDGYGELWRTVAVITEPCVTIEPTILPPDAARRRRQTHVLNSPNMREGFTELRPVTDGGAAATARAPEPVSLGRVPEPPASFDDGTEYRHLAEQVANEALAADSEPVRRALRMVSEQRNAHWRRYVSGLGPQGPAQHGSAVPECAPATPSKSDGAA